MSVRLIQDSLAERDPETLIGPLLYLFTRVAHRAGGETLVSALSDHLIALALHPDVAMSLRLAAGALAIEYRAGGSAARCAVQHGGAGTPLSSPA
jgi:hypothetical protein